MYKKSGSGSGAPVVERKGSRGKNHTGEFARIARTLERIEKEMGYCQIKLEKERRLRKQREFLKADLEVTQHLIRAYSGYGMASQQVAPSRGDKETRHRPPRKAFLASGLLELTREERELLERELKELSTRIRNFAGFESKRGLLEDEKGRALKDLTAAQLSKIRRLDLDFDKIENQWNSYTEDHINFDEAVFFLDRNLDYLRSCRSFLIAAKGNFDIESWVAGGYLSDLFRHSSIGRAKEMADGADRNLKAALKELVCVSNMKIRTDPFQRVLQRFLDALYEDIYIEARIHNSLRVLEEVLEANLKLVEQAKVKRETLNKKLSGVEKQRTRLFNKLDSDRREWLGR